MPSHTYTHTRFITHTHTHSVMHTHMCHHAHTHTHTHTHTRLTRCPDIFSMSLSFSMISELSLRYDTLNAAWRNLLVASVLVRHSSHHVTLFVVVRFRTGSMSTRTSRRTTCPTTNSRCGSESTRYEAFPRGSRAQSRDRSQVLCTGPALIGH